MSSRLRFFLLLAIPFVIWLFLFKGFLFEKYSYLDDAVSYYEETQFFVDSLLRGEYPLWNPHWEAGMPNEFFLRRIGSYNPLYLVIVLARLLGATHFHAYGMFLALNYFLAGAAFFCIGRELFKKTEAAFLAYMLFLFSSLATILVASFIILVITPMLWFFFFALRFLRVPSCAALLGMTTALLLLMTTYIPFYFFTVVFISMFFAGIFYAREIPALMARVRTWAWAHMLLVIWCALCVAVMLIPGIMMFQHMHAGDLVMPVRHYLSSETDQLMVAQQSTSVGGTSLAILFNEMFSSLTRFIPGRFFMSIVAVVFFCTGLFTRVSKRQLVIFASVFFAFLMSIYDATPIYGFLYTHVFFFKYFRNFQFFLWFIILPGCILLAVDHYQQFLEALGRSRRRQWLCVGVGLSCLLLGVMLYYAGQRQVVSFVALVLGGLFLVGFHRARSRVYHWLLIVFVSLGVILQAATAYYFLGRNLRPQAATRYQSGYEQFSLTRPLGGSGDQRIGAAYVSVRTYDELRVKLAPTVFNQYIKNRFVVVNDVRVVSADDVSAVTERFPSTNGYAVVSEPISFTPSLTKKVVDIREGIRVNGYTANTITIATRAVEDFFLVYNDAFYPGWHAYLDGKSIPLYQTNYAFMGVAIPGGEHQVRLQFGYEWQYVLHIMGMILIAVMGVVTVAAFVRCRGDEEGKNCA